MGFDPGGGLGSGSRVAIGLTLRSIAIALLVLAALDLILHQRLYATGTIVAGAALLVGREWNRGREVRRHGRSNARCGHLSRDPVNLGLWRSINFPPSGQRQGDGEHRSGR